MEILLSTLWLLVVEEEVQQMELLLVLELVD
jgi:hypothetical protein